MNWTCLTKNLYMSNTLHDLDSNRGLNIVHLNIRSLWNKFDLFKTTFWRSNVHILGISETWLTKALPDNVISLSGFNIYRRDRNYFTPTTTQIKKGGGICLYIRDTLNGTVKELKDMNVCNTYVECQWLQISFPNQLNIIIGNVYRPPQGNVESYIEYMEGCLENIDYVHSDVFIMGDINIDFSDRNNEAVKDLKEFPSQSGLVNQIKTTTRFSKTKNSCLDHIYTNSNIVNESGTLDVNISDHLPVFVNRKNPNVVYEKTKFIGHSYRRYEKNIFAAELEGANWNVYDAETDPNILYEIFCSNITDTLDTCCPLKNFTVKKYKEPWITNELLELIKDKDLALKKAKRTKIDADWEIAKRL